MNNTFRTSNFVEYEDVFYSLELFCWSYTSAFLFIIPWYYSRVFYENEHSQ